VSLVVVVSGDGDLVVVRPAAIRRGPRRRRRSRSQGSVGKSPVSLCFSLPQLELRRAYPPFFFDGLPGLAAWPLVWPLALLCDQGLDLVRGICRQVEHGRSDADHVSADEDHLGDEGGSAVGQHQGEDAGVVE
jgi:hypothetical protein